MRKSHPIVQMLKWKTRLLSEEEIIQILSAIGGIDRNPFTLTDLTEKLPDSISKNEKKRRSVSTFLSNLVEIGYLTKPSERKWLKNASTLSIYLSPLLIELNDMERHSTQSSEKSERRIIQLEDKR
ncbi:hypothetical protein CSUB_C1625 [Candidatus Caldarchaeum subterraneum]|uniref:Uncharacterized protein n=1 Tax=Caldiarchaeum subterraneum TaxID=311458 RepID=E6N980_CALS0|nr:hypothetical protein HGMM_F52D03C30 [Candidatus Caldarchaeum subterraneum]BAJ51476.1 hypothetical protein CSUB_C1625 [Candidatus Caldarchaeum subterraneum]